jgi:pimeloyl-ACP methyl ester carboxylesterase
MVLLLLPVVSLAAENDAVIRLANGVSYQLIGTYNQDRLNRIGTTELQEFKTVKSDLALAPAQNSVKLYRVSYRTVIPERNNKPVDVTGLIAVPDKAAARYPLVSYQHGTVFSRNEVPSFPEQSMETRLMIAQFAGHGYIVIAADYIGKGSSGATVPDSYMVKESTVQACYDMLVASQAVLADLKLATGDFFLSGWSQGAWSTMQFRNRLESLGMPVKAAAAASTPADLYLLVSRWINRRTTLDADWLVGSAALLVNSYERYYGLPGLSSAAIKPQYWQTARDFYENRIGWSEASKVLPKSIGELFQQDFAAASSLMANRFYRQLHENQAYQWRYTTPSRYYYGKADEVITPYIATLPIAYQDTVGGAAATAVFAGDQADHRGTFIFGVLDQKAWFDSLAGR